jgi:hypothetical protein
MAAFLPSGVNLPSEVGRGASRPRARPGRVRVPAACASRPQERPGRAVTSTIIGPRIMEHLDGYLAAVRVISHHRPATQARP